MRKVKKILIAIIKYPFENEPPVWLEALAVVMAGAAIILSIDTLLF